MTEAKGFGVEIPFVTHLGVALVAQATTAINLVALWLARQFRSRAELAASCSQAHAAIDAGDAVAADPDLTRGVTLNMHASGAAQAGALGCHIGAGCMAVGDQPLGQTGVEAAGDWVFVDAHRRRKGAYFDFSRVR